MNWGCKFFPTRYCWYSGGSTRFYSARLHSDSKHEVTLVSLFKQPPWTPLGNFSLHIFAHHCFVPHKKRCCFNAFFFASTDEWNMRALRSSGWEEIDRRQRREKAAETRQSDEPSALQASLKKRATHACAHQCCDKQTLRCRCLFFFWGSTTIYLFIFHFVAAAAETVNCHAAQIVWSRMCETEQ